MSWNYLQPVKIVFGNNKLNDLTASIKEISGSTGMLVSDPFLVQNGLADKIKELSNGLIKDIYHDISPNPTVKNVDSCTKLMRKHKADFIVALGGGSAIDCAKAASLIANTEDSIIPYHNGEKQLPNTSIPIIAIPTTSGTGSEVTPVAVLSNPDIKKKAPIGSIHLYPKIALVDPTLTLTVPPKVTASTGLDVLSHALEGFWSVHHQPICDATALKACELVFDYLERAYNDGNDLEAREKMSEASLLAGLSFALPKTTGSHACSYPLTTIYGMPHGEACAFTLDYFVRLNSQVENGRLDKFAKILGFKDSNNMADCIFMLKKKFNMKTSLQDAKIEIDDVKSLAKLSMHPNMLNNPVTQSEEDIYKMYLSFTK